MKNKKIEKRKNRTFWQDIVIWMQTNPILHPVQTWQFCNMAFEPAQNTSGWNRNTYKNLISMLPFKTTNICSSQCLICKSVIYAQVISDGHNSFQTALNMIRNHLKCTWEKHYNMDALYQYDVNDISGFAVAITFCKSRVAVCGNGILSFLPVLPSGTFSCDVLDPILN